MPGQAKFDINELEEGHPGPIKLDEYVEIATSFLLPAHIGTEHPKAAHGVLLAQRGLDIS